MTDSRDSKSLRLLIDLLKTEPACLRGAGAFGLSLLGSDAGPAVEALAEALQAEGETEVARAMVFALEDIGVEAAPALVLGLSNPDPDIREEIRQALATLAVAYREGGKDVPELTQAFAEVPELRDLMIPLSEHLGLPPRPPGELAPAAGERDTFKAVARKRELANALRATTPGRRGPH